MGIRDFYKSTREKVGSKLSSLRSYFSRQPSVAVESEKDRESPIGNPYEEKPFKSKKGLASRFFGALGRGVGKLAYYATLATIVIPAINFYRTSPERDVWPFRENRQMAYVILQNFDGTRGRVISPQTTDRFLRPFERDADITNEAGEKISNVIPAGVQEGSNGFQIRSEDGAEGSMKIQYLWRVVDEKGAQNFFWDYYADKLKIDEIVRGALTTTIGKIKGRDIARGFYVDENKNPVDYMREAEDEANLRLKRESVGIRVTNFARESVNLDERSQEILSRILEETENAGARIVRAQSERQEAGIQSQTTLENTQRYIAIGKAVAGAMIELGVTDPAVLGRSLSDVAMQTLYLNEVQQAAHSKARNIVVNTAPQWGTSQPTITMPVNYGPISPRGRPFSDA